MQNLKRLIALDITNILDTLNYKLSLKQIKPNEAINKYILDYTIKKVLAEDFGKIVVLSEHHCPVNIAILKDLYTDLQPSIWAIVREYVIGSGLVKHNNYAIETIIFNRTLHLYLRSY